MATDTKLDSLVINYLTQSQYDTAKTNGKLNENQIYMTPATTYKLPTATSSTLGGVKIGSNITVNSGTISVPNATSTSKGVIQVGSNLSISNGTLSMTEDDIASALNYTPANKEQVALKYSNSNSLKGGADSNTIGLKTVQSGVGSGANHLYYYGLYNGLVLGNNNTVDVYPKSGQNISIPTASIGNGGLVLGSYCKSIIDGEYPKKTVIMLIGNGTSSSTSNSYIRYSDGSAVGGTYSSSGADYAEMFEWQDGNPDGKDRRGKFVTLDGKYIRLANSKDPYILGVVSGNPTVLGDTAEDQWADMYERDIFGTLKYDNSTENGLVLNPNYDNDKQYVARGQRKEWDAIGLMGKLVVVDDGTCEVNGFCSTNDEGIGTKAETGYRVMERLDENHIRVLVK